MVMPAISRGATKYFMGLVDSVFRRVQLFSDAHGADFRCHGRTDAAGDHEAGEHGAKFPGNGHDDHVGDGALGRGNRAKPV